jgi:hypothetical protein
VDQREVGSMEFDLPAAPLAAVRASYRTPSSVVSTCDPSIAYDAYSTAEADDLVFAIDR